jgi:hypothetical protein
MNPDVKMIYTHEVKISLVIVKNLFFYNVLVCQFIFI